jgi:hypothetical protein
MPAEGLEPTRPCGHWILSPARLPIPPRRLGKGHDDTTFERRLNLVKAASLRYRRDAEKTNFLIAVTRTKEAESAA